MNIRLVCPSADYADQVMRYRTVMMENGDSLDGCGGLEETSTFAEWMDFDGRLRKEYGSGYVPSEIRIAIRISDNAVVGMIDYRHPLTPFLLQYGGNIGYSVAPAERRKGYASEMLTAMLDVCRSFGETRVLLTCDPANTASVRTITKCGGILENEVEDIPHLGASGVIRRYWISL